MDPLSLDPDVRVTPSHSDAIESLNGAFLSDIPGSHFNSVTFISLFDSKKLDRFKNLK